MSRIKWFCWALAVFLVTCLVPAKAWCVKIDPYLYRTLIGRITLEYEREDSLSGAKRTRSTFNQIYSLDSKGNILSRRLIIYDAGISFARSDSTIETTTTKESDSTQLNYYLRTTFLPRSRIPFSIFGSRKTRDTSSGRETNTNEYGFEWYGYFIRLPETHVKVERKTQTGTGQDTATMNYRLELDKEWGPTTNALDSKHTTTNNNLTDTSASSSSVNFRNSTRLSSRTQFTVAAAAGHSLSAEEITTTTQGLGASLVSRPGKEFRQSHGYSLYRFTSEDSGEKTELVGSSYNGSMGYRITQRLSSSLGLSINTRDAESGSKTEEEEDVQGRASLNYRATEHLTVSESVSYRMLESGSEADRKTLRVRTNARYSRQFDWASLSGTYHVGYVLDEVEGREEGTGVEQGVGLSLANIEIIRYAAFNASGSHERTKQLTGGIFERSTRYSLEGYNRVGTGYVNLRGNYEHSRTDDWVTGEQLSDSIGASASTAFLKRTRFRASYRWKKSFDDEVGTSRTTSIGLSASHSRTVFRGPLRLHARLNRSKSIFTEGDQVTQTITYLATYGKTLFRILPWQISAERRETEVDDSLTISTSVKNRFFYQLRAWSLSLEQEYKITEDSSGKEVDNRVFARATRAFIRGF